MPLFAWAAYVIVAGISGFMLLILGVMTFGNSHPDTAHDKLKAILIFVAAAVVVLSGALFLFPPYKLRKAVAAVALAGAPIMVVLVLGYLSSGPPTPEEMAETERVMKEGIRERAELAAKKNAATSQASDTTQPQSQVNP